MKKTLTALVPLAFLAAVLIGFVNCGGTGGEGSGFGNQFANTSCNPDSECLELRAPGTLAVGDEAGFTATLRNGDGAPQGDVQICFEFEAGAASVDPACGLTNGNGVVSGTLEGREVGSWIFAAEAPSGFGLRTTRSVRITDSGVSICDSDADCQSNQFCAEPGGVCGFSSPASCSAKRSNGLCCEDDSQCASKFCNPDSSTCSAPPTPVPPAP